MENLDLSGVRRPEPCGPFKAMLLHRFALTGVREGAALPLLLQLFQAITPGSTDGGEGGGGSKQLVNERNFISIENRELLDNFSAWANTQAEHLQTDGTPAGALHSWVQSLMAGRSEAAYEQAARELSGWRLKIEEALGVVTFISWPCPGCGADDDFSLESSIKLTRTHGICTACYGVWEKDEIVQWAARCQERMAGGKLSAALWDSRIGRASYRIAKRGATEKEIDSGIKEIMTLNLFLRDGSWFETHATDQARTRLAARTAKLSEAAA